MATTEVGGSGSSSSSSLGGSANEGGGGSGARGRYVLKKGPWTEAEDAELLNYVKRHGEGNWNVVHKNSGLRRCGKSCRLRWANHLRPNLKKGPLSPEEEEIIIKLHAKYGNKWARMASQLDGRTDNEIKNYWNTKLKKSQRTGLPLYPVQTQQEQTPATSISPSSSLTSIFSASASSSFQQMQQHHPQNTDTYTNNPLPISPLNYPPYRNNIVTTTRKPFSFFSRRYNPSFSFPNIATSPIPFFHQSLSANSLPILDALSLNTGPSMPAMRVTSFDPLSVFILNTSTTGISSIGKQPLVPPPSTAQTSSGNTGSEGGILGGASSSTTEYDHTEAGNSGLLEDLLEQSRTIARLEKLNKDIVREDNELLDQNSLYDFNVGLGHGNPNPEVYLRDSMPTHSDIGMTEKNEILQADMNVLDDDLMRLLECPSPVPIPDWYDDVVATTNYSNGQLPTNVEANVENNK